MRRILAIAIVALCALAAPPARAQLLGLDHYLSPPKVEYSADVVMTGDDDTINGKVVRGHDKERRELTVEGDTEVLIVRLDKQVVWSLSPEDKLYVESTLDEALGRTAGADGKMSEPQIALTKTGEETIEGQQTVKQKVSGKDVDGTPIDGTVWVTSQGIVMRIDSNLVDEEGKHHLLRMELHNLKVGSQDPKLFEIPPGFKRVKPRVQSD